MPERTAIDTAHLFDHTHFAELLNALLDLLDDQAPEAEIDAQLQRLQQHLQRQFAAEEEAMQAAGPRRRGTQETPRPRPEQAGATRRAMAKGT